jgi:hypothetical protein
MPAQLPTTDTLNRQVNTFGIGTYDQSPGGDAREEGDSEVRGESLPATKNFVDGKSADSPDDGSQYSPLSEFGRNGSAGLPGDLDRPSQSRRRPESSVIQPVVQSVAESALPSDENNPPARADYYDKTKVGETRLPGQPKNDQTLERFLGAFGNMWSGWECDDVAQPTSFPGNDRPPEEADKYVSVPVGSSRRAGRPEESGIMQKLATNLDLVGTLAADFLKKRDKKGITRRHVMSFLQEAGYHQYLASDVIRCLQQRHNVHVADVLDQFPVATSKVAASVSAARELVNLAGRMASAKSENRFAAAVLGKLSSTAVSDASAMFQHISAETE